MKGILLFFGFVVAWAAAAPLVSHAQIVLTPPGLFFGGPVGGTFPSQTVSVTHPTPVPWNTVAVTTSGGNWLNRSPSSGTTNSTMTVSVNTAGLNAGTYQGYIDVIIQMPGGFTTRLNVTLALSGSGQEVLTISPSGFSTSAGANAPSTFHLEVSSTFVSAVQGGTAVVEASAPAFEQAAATLNWTAAVRFLNGSGWLTISPTSGSASASSPTSVTGTINYAAISTAGVYQALIVFTDTASRRSVNFPVTVTVGTPNQGRLLLSQSSLFFSTAPNSPTGAPPQSLRVFNAGQGTLSWTISGLPSWLTASPASGTATTDLSQVSSTTLTANGTGLAAGVYQAVVSLSASGAANSPQLLTVTLHVVPDATPPAAVLDPNAIVFVALQGMGAPPAQNLTISNGGGGTLSFNLVTTTTSGGSWLTVTPAGGVTSSGPATVVVRTNPIGLGPNVYRGKITVNVTGGSPQEVEVILILALPAAAVSACTPTAMELVGTTLGTGQTLAVSFPKIVLALAVDTCGNAVTNASVTALLDGTDVPLQPLGTGLYTGLWVPQRIATNISAALIASHPSFSNLAQKFYTISTAASATGIQLPVFFDGGAVDGAAFLPRRPLVPGGIISLFGARLAGGTASAPSVPLPTDLTGVSVRLGGQAIPLYFVSAGQVNAQVPFEAVPGSSVSIVVNSGGRLTAQQSYPIAAAQPAIFKVGANAAVLDTQFRLITAQNPALTGDTILIFATGLGLTDVAVQTGSGWPGLSNVRVPVTVTIGGATASVGYQGLAPNFVGLYQVNATIPSTVAPGDAVPVVLTQNGVPSNADSPLTIPVRAR